MLERALVVTTQGLIRVLFTIVAGKFAMMQGEREGVLRLHLVPPEGRVLKDLFPRGDRHRRGVVLSCGGG